MGGQVSKPEYEEEVKLFDDIDKWTEKVGWFPPKLKVVVAGLVGAGKSTLVNGLSGQEICRMGESDNVDKPCTPRCEKMPGPVAIWDTPGFIASSEESLKQVQDSVYQVTSKDDLRIFVYAINMTLSRFEKNAEDLKVLKEFYSYHEENLWDKAIIVLTQADLADLELALWSKKIREHLVSEVGLKKELAQSIPILPSGYYKETQLDIQPNGMSWITKIWLTFLKFSIGTPFSQTFIEILLGKVFQEPNICGAIICEFLDYHELVYLKRASQISTNGNRDKISHACSFLHAQNFMFSNHAALLHENLCLEQEEQNILTVNFWKKISKRVKILVTGNSDSGKTALMNSLFWGREELVEGASAIPRDGDIEHSSLGLTCHVKESPGLDSGCPTGLDFNLVLFCVGVHHRDFQTMPNMQKLTDAYGQEVWNKAIIVFTEANVDFSEEEYERKAHTFSEFMKKITKDVNVPITQAGYHMQNRLHKKGFWVIDLWMIIILALEAEYQPAMITILNDCLLEPNLVKNAQGHEQTSMVTYYKYHLIETLSKVLKNCNLK